MLMMGENPFLSDPNINKVRKALAAMEFLVVQDIFLTETAEFADVILPASTALEKTGTYTNTDRRVQLGRPAMDPPGQARLDWEILCDIATRMGYPMRYDSPAAIFEEFAELTESYKGLTHANLGATGKLWPCPDPATGDGIQVLFDQDFPSGRGKFVPAESLPAKELPDAEYPMVLNTGRVLEHWHTGSMTRRVAQLHQAVPEAYVEINRADAIEMGINDGDRVKLVSRRGEMELTAHIDRRGQPPRGSVFVPFFDESKKINELTLDAMDNISKEPDYKKCAVRVERA
jgi:formate dehydrogenase major subunit